MKEKTLRALRETKEEYLSGEVLSNLLGVSRTAVWKAVQALRQEGYDITSQARSGYRLNKIPDRLLPAEISWGLKTRFLGHHIHYYETMSSTNIRAKELARQGAGEGTLVVAEEQVEGRGRRGRTWHSPPGEGVLFSFILRPALQPTHAPQLTFMASVAVAKTLREDYNLPAGIKWPNDIFIRGRKVAGILTELSAEVDRINFVAMGIGVNVNTELASFSPFLRERVTSLRVEKGHSLARVPLLQRLLLSLEEEYTALLEGGFAPLRRRWLELNLVLGKRVRIISPERSFTGTAVNVDEYGALLVQEEGAGLRRVLAGDVSLREGG
ncbi:MAG: biotin--[acetyl-CoA-carboxylase] ligase [Firmicutes bacterium]|nr:biotin--[acetyl-CoA-carboxylase] ligase [Bacillota bacterium]